MKIVADNSKTINECLGMSNKEYIQLSEDIKTLILDRYTHNGKCNHVVLIRFMMENSRDKHLGKTDVEFSEYECELFLSGMIMKFMLLPSVQHGIQSLAYAKQLSDGLNEI